MFEEGRTEAGTGSSSKLEGKGIAAGAGTGAIATEVAVEGCFEGCSEGEKHNYSEQACERQGIYAS